jgi:hypothetical protein
MRQILTSVLFLYCLSQEEAKAPKLECSGYRKIEYGKGIDCAGDTIRIKEAAEFNREYYKK